MTLRGAVLSALTLAACTGDRKPAKSPVVAAAEGALAGRIFEAPSPNRDGRLRILISHDMEGLSGQDDPRTFQSSHPEEFKRGQQLLADDVNAVIEGLFAGGASAVDVFDQHGSGRPDSIPDLPPALLDQRARQVFMSEAISQEIADRGNYDALVTVGEHGPTGSGGFAAHSVTLGIELLLNGLSVTEVELKALQWGQFGVPLIFSSGDDALAKSLAPFSWVEVVTVKRGTSASTAELRPVDEVHAEMRTRAKLAIERLGQSRVMRLTTPVRVSVRAVPPASIELLRDLPGLEPDDQGVSFEAPALDPPAFAKLIAVISVASVAGRYQLLRERLLADPAGRKILESNEDAYVARWLDYESGRWKPLPAEH